MPALARAAKTVFAGNADAALLGIGLDGEGQRRDAALRAASYFARRYGLTHKNLVWFGPTDALAAKFQLRFIPLNVFVNAKGDVLGRTDVDSDPAKAEADLRRELAELLSKALPKGAAVR